jgi:hypothetical protein
MEQDKKGEKTYSGKGLLNIDFVKKMVELEDAL